jgi:hypothetical protein
VLVDSERLSIQPTHEVRVLNSEVEPMATSILTDAAGLLWVVGKVFAVALHWPKSDKMSMLDIRLELVVADLAVYR